MRLGLGRTSGHGALALVLLYLSFVFFSCNARRLGGDITGRNGVGASRVGGLRRRGG